MSGGRFKLGDVRIDPRSLDLAAVEVSIQKNKDPPVHARSAAVMDHPANAIAEYVNLLYRLGYSLEAGDIVLSGAITAALPLARGDLVGAEFAGMGAITVRVV
jgi:2-oxopent-4-enoate/cis-2-oxohex-4-enoate hydratase